MADAGIVFIGPPASAIATMGDKITARAPRPRAGTRRARAVAARLTDDELIAAARNRVPCTDQIAERREAAGRACTRVGDPADLPDALVTARRGAAGAFGDDALFLEHFVDTRVTSRCRSLPTNAARLSTSASANAPAASPPEGHRGSPSALLDAATRERIGTAACDAARSVGYTTGPAPSNSSCPPTGLTSSSWEMNTRLQVEHPVTEMVTGIDLVEQQIRVARGERLGITQDDIVLNGHAVEARVLRRGPAAGFLPTGGTGEHPGMAGDRGHFRGAGGLGIDAGSVIGTDYDPMLAKIICHGADRTVALDRLDEALAKTVLAGVGTNVDFADTFCVNRRCAPATSTPNYLDRLAADYARCHRHRPH